jgi:hypothetical protein
MANPIKETPVLYGEDALWFAERIENPKMESKEKVEQMRIPPTIVFEPIRLFFEKTLPCILIM